jgi:hypothetical protein
MTNDTPAIRYDAKHYTRRLIAFYVGLTPLGFAMLYTVFIVDSFALFLVVSLVGFLATFAFTMQILPYPICPTCAQPIRKRLLDIHMETREPAYCCSVCNTHWIVALEPNSNFTGPHSVQSGG